MILIITHKDDYTADFLIDKLNKQKLSYYRLNCEDLLSAPLFTISYLQDYELRINGFEITSVWFRRTQIPNFGSLSLPEKFYLAREFEALLENIYTTLVSKKWLSDPFSVRKAENKLYQLRVAKDLGFKTPRTLVTNSKDRIREFFKENHKTIIKPIYSGYVPNGQSMSHFYTNILTEKHIKELDEADLTPCIFQEYVEKEYELRITVVDEAIFTAKVESQKHDNAKIDWRREQLIFTKEEIPKRLRVQCLNLCKALNIKFGAIDIIKGTDGTYTFLEINPNGQWAWIEMETDLRISDAIITYLKS